MGMYSTIQSSCVNIKDLDGYKLILSKLKEKYEYLAACLKEDEISFYSWSDWKIEGYWYPDMVAFLNELAPYVEGYAEFSYEEGYNFRIVFQDNNFLYQRQPSVDWSEAPLLDLTKELKR